LSDKQVERLEEILDGLDSGELSLENLSREELKEFENFIKDKRNLEGLLKEWVPWWKRESFSYYIDIQELNPETPDPKDPKEEKFYD
jgi:hypothetical protein